MKLILHHLWKDIRAQRWLIALWLLVVLAMALPEILIFQPDYAAARAMDTLSNSPIAMLLGILVWTIILARLIQSEPVTGSTSFWLTRPIAKRVSLPAQFLFILVFIMLPAFVPVIVQALVFQMDARALGSELLGWAVFQVIGAICVIWLATYTPSLIHLAGCICLGAVFFFLTVITRAELYQYSGQQPSATVFIMVICTGFIGSLVIAHRQRGTRLGFYVGACPFFLALAYGAFAPGTSVQAKAYSADQVGKTERVDFDPGWLETLSWSDSDFTGGDRAPAAYALLEPVQENPASRIWVTNVAAHFTVPGDFSGALASVGTGAFFIGGTESKTLELIQAQLPGIKFAQDQHPGPRNYSTGLFNLHGFESTLRDKTGMLRLDVSGCVLSLQQIAALPLSDHRFIARLHVGFIRLAPQPPGEFWDLTLWSIKPENISNASLNQYICVLVDPQTATGKILPSSGGSSFTNLGVAGQRVEDSLDHYSLDGTLPLDRMVLYVFQYVPTANFTTTLVAPDFKMSPTLPPVTE